jgi:hypothetical protein
MCLGRRKKNVGAYSRPLFASNPSIRVECRQTSRRNDVSLTDLNKEFYTLRCRENASAKCHENNERALSAVPGAGHGEEAPREIAPQAKWTYLRV